MLDADAILIGYGSPLKKSCGRTKDKAVAGLAWLERPPARSIAEDHPVERGFLR